MCSRPRFATTSEPLLQAIACRARKTWHASMIGKGERHESTACTVLIRALTLLASLWEPACHLQSPLLTEPMQKTPARHAPALFKSLLSLMLSLTLYGCAIPAQQRLMDQLPAERQLLVLETQSLPLLAGVSRNLGTISHLRVYIEGDGRAWITPSQPSLDPTPGNDWFALLALNDPQPSAWLARPCQYIRTAACQPRLWTDARFSAEVLKVMNQALDQLKQRFNSDSLELIGYSGGATLALLLASQRDDVTAVQSLAGNLSPRLWARHQKLSPLRNSLDPLDQRTRLSAVPQRHLVGTADSVVPAELAEQWRSQLGNPPCLEIVRIEGIDHEHGWREAWRALRGLAPRCLLTPDSGNR